MPFQGGGMVSREGAPPGTDDPMANVAGERQCRSSPPSWALLLDEKQPRCFLTRSPQLTRAGVGCPVRGPPRSTPESAQVTYEVSKQHQSRPQYEALMIGGIKCMSLSQGDFFESWPRYSAWL